MSESKDTKDMSQKKHIIIAGAGIIGTSTAYYLSKNFSDSISAITLIDPSGKIAPAASGKAGGFLALDWNDYSSVGPLSRRSFDLHSQLADEFGKETIMYRRLTCASISVRNGGGVGNKPSGKKLAGVEWASDLNEDTDADGVAVGFRPLGDESTIAQVHPKMLCETLWKAVTENSFMESKIVKEKVVDAVHDDNGNLIGVTLGDGTIVNGDRLLWATGPWTTIGNCMVGVKYHSVLIPTEKVLTQSVFYDGFGDPEIYPRPDGTTYCCGFPDAAVKVVEEPGKEEVRQEKVDEIVDAVRKCSGGKDGALGKEPQLAQSCYLPTTIDNVPIMGEIEGKNGCFVASGHSCWGVLNGPGTGEAMASLIMTGESKHLNLSSFNPNRFG